MIKVEVCIQEIRSQYPLQVNRLLPNIMKQRTSEIDESAG